MIEQIKSCNDQLANKLASIEQNIFGTCWPPEVLKEKINNGEFLYWIFNKNNNIYRLILFIIFSIYKLCPCIQA